MSKRVKFFVTLIMSISSITIFGSLKPQNEQPGGSSKQQESQPAPQGQVSSQAGVHSVTGCVSQSDHGYSLKTKTATYDIDTDQDLSQYVGKQIRISGIWEHHKATAHTPTGSGNEASASAAGGDNPSPASGHGPVAAREFRLRTVTSVVGDCH